MKEFNAKATSYDSRIKLVDKFLDNMVSQRQGTGVSGILLAGDPGVGKTSFVKFLSQLLGIKLITIEAPHLTEEHIINIPFIVFDPTKKSEKEGVGVEKEADYKIVLSQSHLVSEINHVQKIEDQEYLNTIKSAPADVKKIFEKYGGDDHTVPDEFAEVREHFKCLLFLDEFYRQTSTRIRNMLRGILNGNIGTDKVPQGTYVLYASNLDDNNETVEGIPLNHQYAKTIEFTAPNKDDWFGYFVSKFEHDDKVHLNKKVIDKFYDLLEEEDINHFDPDAGVRIAPRRWEQLLLYINSSLPVKNEKEALALMTNVKANFKDYLTGEHAKLVKAVLKATSELIDDISGVKVGENATNDDSDWRDTLEHQIATKIKLGEHRKYIPIMSGLPGIGKTTHAARVAEHLNLRYIHIDCSTLDPEDVIGIPLSKTSKKDGEDHVETKFSEPKLYKHILAEAKRLDKEHLDEVKDDKGAVEEYKKQHFKYLIFFDELNRATPKVFNGLRRVILEKSFGDNLNLPTGSIVVAAINPHDRGAYDLTKHMKDVVDVIDSAGSWDSTVSYLKSMPVKVKNEKSKDVVLDVIETFANKFKDKSDEVKSKQKQFYLDVGAERVYISPREYADLYSNTAIGFDRQWKRIIKNGTSEMTNEELHAAEEKLRDTLYESFKDILTGIFKKQDVDSPTFFEDLKEWFMHSPEVDLGEGLFYKKQKSSGFGSIVGKYFDDPNKNLAEDDEFFNYIDSVEPHTFASDLSTFTIEKLDDDDKILENIKKKERAKKVFKDNEFQKVEDQQMSKIEHFFRELIHTFNYHKFSNEKRQSVTEAVWNAMDTLCEHAEKLEGAIGEELLDDILHIQKTIGKFVKGKSD